MSKASHQLALVLLYLTAFTLNLHVSCGSCMPSEMVYVKFKAFAVRAQAYGLPRKAVLCVHRALQGQRMLRTTARSKSVECVASQRLGTVMGSSMPNCVDQSGGADRPIKQFDRLSTVDRSKLAQKTERFFGNELVKLQFASRKP